MVSESTELGATRRQVLQALGAAALAGLAAAWPAHRAHASAAVLLARAWTPGDDPSGWLVSEKLDGVRALWDGQRLRFRSGRAVAAPASFLARLPGQALDGELWLGHGRFDELSGLVRRAEADAQDWARVQYQVFELPGGDGTFAQRAQRLQAIVQQQRWPQLLAVAQQAVGSVAQLQQRLEAVVRQGGEGLMLHRADAAYATGRSDALRKFKPLDDAEAIVLAHRPGQGRLAGQMGALRVRTSDGREFDIGTGFDDATRAHPPRIGQRITFTHRGLTGQGLPRFASYLRLAPEF
jgi:DNA ligase 1